MQPAAAGWLAHGGRLHPRRQGSSPGVYWRPVHNLLEGSRAVVLVNAQHVKLVPGRKTDVRESEWLEPLFELGLLRCSFVPLAA